MSVRLWVVAAGLLGIAACSETPYTNLDNRGLQDLMAQGVPVFDVRRPEEWRETGVIEGSERLTFIDRMGRVRPDFLPRLTARVGKNDPLILICRTGTRTSQLARYLAEQMGYRKVYNVQHGITQWIQAGLPVSRSER